MEKYETSKPKILTVLKALIISYGVTALVLVILAFLLYKFHIGEQVVNIGVLAVYVLSCFMGGLYIGRKTGNRKFLWGFLQGILYFLLLLIISMVMHREQTAFSQQMIVAFAMCVAGGTIGGMIS